MDTAICDEFDGVKWLYSVVKLNGFGSDWVSCIVMVGSGCVEFSLLAGFWCVRLVGLGKMY